MRPDFDMCRAATAVHIGNAVGPGRTLTFGLPAGCPFATFFLAMVTQPWRKQLRNLPAISWVRKWVDGCTAFVQGAVSAIGLAREAGRAADAVELFSTKVNKTKSGVVAATPLQAEMMRMAAGPNFQRADVFKDLGCGPRQRSSRVRSSDAAMAHCVR